MLRIFTRNSFCSIPSTLSAYFSIGTSNSPSNNLPNMNDKSKFKRTKYDGRSKKRQWEERRSDKGAAVIENPKQPRLDETDEAKEVAGDKVKRRKFCLLLGYSGVDYYGMQRNPHTKTIEEDLFNALLKAGFINEDCYSQVQNMQFQRAARTDKGVSAARQIVSMKLGENIDISKINAELPEVIRVFACKRVTKGFNSKTQCDGRTYLYVLPTVAFADFNDEVNQSDYRLSEEKFNEVNETLKNFIGTKNFHNYTSKKKPGDPSANRYIKSFFCEKPFIKDSVEFAVLKVFGQSFMMHQIRKMVGCLLAVVRGYAPKETISDSFKQEKVNIPRAPGLGLVLDYVHYDNYNYRYGKDGMHQKLTWEEVENDVNEFKEKYIYPTIINTEIKDKSMVNWLMDKLCRHSYDLEEEDNGSDEEGGDDDEEKEYEHKEIDDASKKNEKINS